MSVQLLTGDCRATLPTLPDKSVNCCVTSPPYFGLRDYKVAGQIGLEKTPDEYVSELVAVFREVKRVLRDDGTLWINLGDTFAANRGYQVPDSKHVDVNNCKPMMAADLGLKPKNLIGIPWRVAFALQADGWWLRSDIIWSKPNPMPESVTDRPTKAHEYIFLLAKSERYFYDVKAIAEPLARPEESERKTPAKFGGSIKHVEAGKQSRLHSGNEYKGTADGLRNRRSVWTVATQPYSGAHFAVFPEALVEPCILAGCPEGGTVLDPFGGSGTVGRVAVKNRRNAILIELNPEYVELQNGRVSNVQVNLF